MFAHSLQSSQRNSPQRESANQPSFGQEAFSVRQRHREQRDAAFEAAEAVANMNIRRGNRRGSIDDTNFKSLVDNNFVRKYQQEIYDAFNENLFNNKEIDSRAMEIYDAVLASDIARFAYLTECLQAGNCNEFVDVVTNYIMQNTKEQALYQVVMIGQRRTGEEFDHVITLVSSEQTLQTDIWQLDQDNTVVIDAWHNNRVQTLRQFYEGDNPYGERVGPANLKIAQSHLTEGLGERVTDREQAVIKDCMREAIDEVKQKHRDEYSRTLQKERSLGLDDPDFFDFPRGTQVNDTRPRPAT